MEMLVENYESKKRLGIYFNNYYQNLDTRKTRIEKANTNWEKRKPHMN